MSEPVEQYNPALLQKKTAVSAFLNSLVTSAKTAGLYKDGHPSIAAIAQRMTQLLQKTLGQESNLTLEVKAKTVLVEEAPLGETAEVVAFASALHTLGIGQVVFSNRITPEGMREFFRILIAKPDEKNTLTDLQKAVQNVHIDGLQMVFILSFVVTGETEEKKQIPGQLSEEQILAFISAATLPDFLSLLLKQNEDLSGKDAERIGDLLDSLLYRELPVEDFVASMPWSFYDPRIRQRFEEFLSRMDLISWASILDKSDAAALKNHHHHEKKDSVAHAFEWLSPVLDSPAVPSQKKYAIFAYVRLLSELARDGDIPSLLKEYGRWQAMESSDPPNAALLKNGIQEKLLGPALASHIADYLGRGSDSSSFLPFALYMGEDMLPLLLEQLRNTQDQSARQRLCSLLAALGKAYGEAHLAQALKDPDWFLVTNVVGILGEMGSMKNLGPIAALLKHEHRKVREAATRFLAKAGGTTAIDALGEFVARPGHAEADEIDRAVIALSLINDPQVGERLVAAFRRTTNPQCKLALVRALGRFPSQESVRLLKEVARRSWYEILSGANKDLRLAARKSLEAIGKERK